MTTPLEHSLNIIKCQKWSNTFLPKQENFKRTYIGLKAHLCTIVRSQIKITTNRQGELCHFILRLNPRFTKIGQKELLTIANLLYKIVNVDGECQRTMGRERERGSMTLFQRKIWVDSERIFTPTKKMVVSCTSFWSKWGCLDQAAMEIVPLYMGIFLGFRTCCNGNNTPHRAHNLFTTRVGLVEYAWLRSFGETFLFYIALTCQRVLP